MTHTIVRQELMVQKLAKNLFTGKVVKTVADNAVDKWATIVKIEATGFTGMGLHEDKEESEKLAVLQAMAMC